MIGLIYPIQPLTRPSEEVPPMIERPNARNAMDGATSPVGGIGRAELAALSFSSPRLRLAGS